MALSDNLLIALGQELCVVSPCTRKANTMQLVVTEFMTLDGIVEAPDKWSFEYWNDTTSKFKLEERKASKALLLGRVTYENFAASWPDRHDEFADMMNQMPKYVVTKTLRVADWQNSNIIGEQVVERIRALKNQGDGDLLVDGSPTLVRTLIAEDLVDRYNLLVYPLIYGSGKRLFDAEQRAKLRLTETKDMGAGVVALIYEPHR